MKNISKNQALSYILDHQLPPPRMGKQGTLDTIEQLGYVQIDTISVVARAHHHVLWTRISDYQPAYLKSLVERDKKVFDYWAHAASYLPMRDYRFSLYRKWEKAQKDKHWYAKNPQLMGHVLDQIKERGPMMSKDFEKGEWQKKHAWGLPPVKQALMHLFMDGKIMIVGRQGFQKIYDFPENFLPPEVNTQMPARVEYIQHIIRRDIGAHGLMNAKNIGHLLKISLKEKQAQIDNLVKSGLLIPVKIKGTTDRIYYAFAEKLDNYQPLRRDRKVHILSPFDNLIILRNRIKQLFDLSYTLECYVTEKKRKFGYFCLPILYGKEFVGLIDLKADRKTKILWIKNLVWLKDVKKIEPSYPIIYKKLQTFQRFNNCKKIQTIPDTGKHFLSAVRDS